MRDLKGITAIVTGSAGGIGPYIVRGLAKKRTNLVLAGPSFDELEEVATQARESGVRVISVLTDVTDQKALEHLVTVVHQEFGGVDVLVNNAGIEKIFPYHKLQIDDIEQVIQVNLIGAMLLTRMVLPGMLERRRGHIVNISSLSGKVSPPYAEPYVASKAGLVAFTESLRAEYRNTGVSASVICPGFVDAGIYKRLRDEMKLEGSRMLGTSTPEAVAKAVVRSIKKDMPEIIVNPGPTRVLTTLAELSPPLGEWIMRISGVSDWFRKASKLREGKSAGTGNGA